MQHTVLKESNDVYRYQPLGFLAGFLVVWDSSGGLSCQENAIKSACTVLEEIRGGLHR